MRWLLEVLRLSLFYGIPVDASILETTLLRVVSVDIALGSVVHWRWELQFDPSNGSVLLPLWALVTYTPFFTATETTSFFTALARSAAESFFNWKSPLSMFAGSLDLFRVVFLRLINLGADLPKWRCAISTFSVSHTNSSRKVYSSVHNSFQMYV